MTTPTIPTTGLEVGVAVDEEVATHPAEPGGPAGGLLRRLVRGRPADPAWVRPTLLALLVGTLGLYLWGLGRNGWANEFYSAAVQAGSTSWKAFFFGSSDAGNTITVDKPPLSLWPMALSVRLFGLSSWSILVPQALMGTATVGVVYATVRRWFTPGAGLLAGLTVALTPVAALMFRFNNPDALLTLLMALGAYAALRAIEEDRFRWYVLTGVAVGLGFLTKQLQVFLVVPGFALALLVAGAGSFLRRLRGLLIAGVAVLISAGWWVAIVELLPASSRPYVGGSQHNSFLELTFGYNGLGRITGNESSGLGGLGGGTGGPGGAGGGLGSMFGGTKGIGRMFNGVIGGQVAWLIPLALVALVAGLLLRGRRPRTDMGRASLVVWGSWLVVTGLVFSFMSGVFHEYYTVALAPPIGALVGIGGATWWRHRDNWAAMATAAVAVAGTTWWARELLGRAPTWNSWLIPAVTAVGAAAAVGLLAGSILDATGRRVPRHLVAGIGAVAAVAIFVGPVAWTVQTVLTAHVGSIVTAGPAVTGGTGRGGFPGGAGGQIPDFAGGQLPAFPGGGQVPDVPGGQIPDFAGGQIPDFAGGQLPAFPGGAGAAGGGIPGAGTAARPSDQVLALLEQDADQYTWVAATMGSTAAAPYQLATQRAVMPLGGFSSGDPSPTLEQFQQDVADKKIHWFIGGGAFGGGGFAGGAPGAGDATAVAPAGVEPETSQTPNVATTEAQKISTWVSQNFASTTVDGVTLYDLTATPTPQ
ncbi:MAG: ArnT family glycosyltransferase [Acidimicrobiales bacterium]